MASAPTKQYVHELIERIAPSQVPAVVGILESMLDPVSVALANAPYDDEPVSEDERREIESSREWFKHNQGTPHEEILAEFGLSAKDLEGAKETPNQARSDR